MLGSPYVFLEAWEAYNPIRDLELRGTVHHSQPDNDTADTDLPRPVQLPFLLYCTIDQGSLDLIHLTVPCQQAHETGLTKGTLQQVTVQVHLCIQRLYYELPTGEFIGGGAPLPGADGRKPCVQPPPLLTRQCTNFSSSTQCLVSKTTTAQRCLYNACSHCWGWSVLAVLITEGSTPRKVVTCFQSAASSQTRNLLISSSVGCESMLIGVWVSE